MGNLIEKLNRMGVRMEEIEERQDCLEDKVSEHHPPTPIASSPTRASDTARPRRGASSTNLVLLLMRRPDIRELLERIAVRLESARGHSFLVRNASR